MRGARWYRALLLLYPRSFRREYGEEMLRCVRDARRDRLVSAPRLAVDLLATVPARHLEVIVHMQTTSKLLVAAIVTTIGIVAVAVVGGAIAAIALMVLLAWILWSLLRARGAEPGQHFWWKTAAVGAGVFALAFVVFAPPWPESWREAVPGEVAWFTGFLAFTGAIVCMVVGLLGGIVTFAARRRAIR